MTRREIENRVLDMAWPVPSPNLRARVLADAMPHPAGAADARRRTGTTHGGPGAPLRRRWRLVPAFVVIVALLVIGACAGFDVWMGHELNAEIARLEAKYGSLDESTLQSPAVPEADNRARVVRAAAALAVPRRDTAYHYINRPVPSPVPADLRAFADANRDAVRVVWDVRTRRRSTWETDYRTGANFPSWYGIRIVSDATYVTALLDIEAGLADEAAQMFVAGLGIAASLRQEPGAIPINAASRPLEGIRQLLNTSTPSAAALKDLAWWLAESRMPDATRMYLLGHMKRTNAMFMRMEQGDIDPSTAHYIYPMTWPDGPEAFLGIAAQIGRPFVRTARIRYLRHMERLIDADIGPRPRVAIQEPEPPKRWALVDRLVEKFTAGTWPYNDISDDDASELGATEIAVALHRHKMDRGAYPDDLSTLVPDYLDRLPIDPYTGRSPIYARQGSGFTLKSTASAPYPVSLRALEWNVAK